MNKELSFIDNSQFAIPNSSFMSYQISKNILATVTYYDVLSFPLTAFEAWKHMINYASDFAPEVASISLGDVVAALETQDLRKKVEEKNGFYFLRGKERLVEKRIRAEKISVRKLKRMRSLVKILAWVPYLRMIGATGSLSMKNGTTASDWDMFVVFRSGRIWLGRTLLTGFLHAIGKRRHGKKIVDRACLNYFVSDSNLEITTKDLFSAHEYHFLIPFFSFANFARFERENAWIKRYKPQYGPTLAAPLWSLAPARFQASLQKILEGFFDLFSLEAWLKNWQKKKIEANPNTALSGSLIEASDRALIFLPHPRGPKVFDEFKQRLEV